MANEEESEGIFDHLIDEAQFEVSRTVSFL